MSLILITQSCSRPPNEKPNHIFKLGTPLSHQEFSLTKQKTSFCNIKPAHTHQSHTQNRYSRGHRLELSKFNIAPHASPKASSQAGLQLVRVHPPPCVCKGVTSRRMYAFRCTYLAKTNTFSLSAFSLPASRLLSRASRKLQPQRQTEFVLSSRKRDVVGEGRSVVNSVTSHLRKQCSFAVPGLYSAFG